jgi:hypothetical protein
MELLQSFVVDLAWFFFAAWSTTLAALAVITFKPDILARPEQPSARSDTR